MTRKFFQIGFNKCGTTFIARLFQMNGIPALHWLEGALAEDIAYARLTGRQPLQRWAADTVAFTDMESVRYLNMPAIEGFREYAFLDRAYPGSVFLLNTRRLEDWIASRYMHRGGTYARAWAQILGVGLGDLADIWAADWQAHLAGCRAHFAGRREFVEIDIDEAGPQDYRDALSPWFELPHCPPVPGAGVRKVRAGYLPRLARMLDMPRPGADLPEDLRQRTAEALARHARPATVSLHPGKDDAPSPQFALFDAATAEVRAQDGSLLPLRRGEGGKYHLDPAHSGLLRIATTVNDIAEVTDRGTYRLDMRPACRLGSDASHPVAGPVIAPSRRAGARNVFLWPMPWIHRLGNDGFLGPLTRPDPDFADKWDRAVWRGGLAGYASGDGGPDLDRPVEAAIATLLQAPEGSAAFGQARQVLQDSSRLSLMARADADLDAALVADARTRAALRRAGLEVPLADRHDDAFLLSHRYLVCLGGTVGSEDFLPLANSHSVVLKEEDGWELFPSGLFQPWQHYIPLQWGGADLPRQLAWARANPDACRRISAAARQLCAVLADPECRRRHLAQVLRDYRIASGQAA